MIETTKHYGIWIGTIIGIIGTIWFKESTIIQTPISDSKIQSNYMRNGFSNILMAPTRRRSYSNCYENFVKTRSTATSRTESAANASSLNSKQEELPSNERIEGSLTYVFHLAEDGKVNHFDLAVDELSDQTLSNCIEQAFKGVRFLPPPLGINRYIAYEMTFKRDETLKREQAEKQNNPPLTLVPTPNSNPQLDGSSQDEKPTH
jgi:hypothetical protein